VSTKFPADRSHLGIWACGSVDIETHRQTWLFSSTSTYHPTDLLTARGVAHLVVHGTSGSTNYETISPVRLETSGDVLSTVDMVVQRRDDPRWLRELDDDDVRSDKEKTVYHKTKAHRHSNRVHVIVNAPTQLIFEQENKQPSIENRDQTCHHSC